MTNWATGEIAINIRRTVPKSTNVTVAIAIARGFTPFREEVPIAPAIAPTVTVVRYINK